MCPRAIQVLLEHRQVLLRIGLQVGILAIAGFVLEQLDGLLVRLDLLLAVHADRIAGAAKLAVQLLMRGYQVLRDGQALALRDLLELVVGLGVIVDHHLRELLVVVAGGTILDQLGGADLELTRAGGLGDEVAVLLREASHASRHARTGGSARARASRGARLHGGALRFSAVVEPHRGFVLFAAGDRVVGPEPGTGGAGVLVATIWAAGATDRVGHDRALVVAIVPVVHAVARVIRVIAHGDGRIAVVIRAAIAGGDVGAALVRVLDIRAGVTSRDPD